MSDEHRQLVYNAMRTPDGTILESMHRHDYVTHVDATNGHTYMLDGGTCGYVRYNIAPDIEWLSVYADEPFEKVRQFATRGSRGKDGRSTLTWVKLCHMSNEHIENVIVYGGADWHIDLMRKELQYRKDNNIFIHDQF